jgi:hypothetical protein
VGIDRAVFRFAAVDGLHRESVTQDESNPLLGAAIGEPIPGEDTFYCHDEPLAVWSNGLEKRFRGGFHIAVHKNFAIMAQDADVHGAGMQVDTTVNGVWLGVESPEVSSSFVSERFSQRQQSHRGMLRGRPQSLSRVCSRPLTASAPLPFSAAADAWRSPLYTSVVSP